jgi:hypothetical protein
VVCCRPVPMGEQRRLRRATVLRCGRLHRLPHSGACRQRDAARGDRQLGVPVEDYTRVRPPAGPPLSPLQPPSHAFKRPAWYFASHARCSQGHRRLPRPSWQRAADDLRADRAHVPVRPLHAAGLAADAAPASQRERVGGSSSARPHASLCAIRDLAKNGFTGPILASITPLTRLVFLYAAPPPVRSPGRRARAEPARCGAGTSARTASPAACRRRSPR